MLAKQGGLKPVFDQPLARPGDRVDTGLQRRRDLAIAPARTTLRGVSFQQDAGLQQLLCRMFPAMDKGGELLSFLIAECHNVLLYRDLFSGHEPAPSLVTEASRQKIDVESMTDTNSRNRRVQGDLGCLLCKRPEETGQDFRKQSRWLDANASLAQGSGQQTSPCLHGGDWPSQPRGGAGTARCRAHRQRRQSSPDP